MSDLIALVPYEASDYDAIMALDLYELKNEKSMPLLKSAEVDEDALLYTVRKGTRVGGLLYAVLHSEDTIALQGLFIDASLRIATVVKSILKGFIAMCRQGGVKTITADVDASSADYMKHAGFKRVSKSEPHRLTYTLE